MTKRQRIELRRSEIRSRLGEIADLTGDAVTDEIRTERDGLMTEMRESEGQLQAALVAEETETRQSTQTSNDDPESAELRRLESRASIGAVFSAAIEHRQTDGETAELQQHLGLAPNQIPLALLRGPAEQRTVEKRAVTPAPADVGQTQSAIIPAVFPRAAGSWLSVDMPTVTAGDASFPVLTTNAAPGTPAKGAAQAETTGAFSAEVLTPKRIQASFFYGREDRARFMGMNEALRMNLSDALSDKLDAEIIAGPNGLLTGTNITRKAATGVTTFSEFRKEFFALVDGTYAWGADDLRVLFGSATFGLVATTFLDATDSQSVLDSITRVAGGIRVSAHVPAVANDKQDALVRLGMRRDMVAPVWEGITLIPDEVTKAAEGQIVLTAVMLHAVKILRSDGFKKIETQHA